MTKKEAILLAGTKLFARKGFSGTSMAELAEMTNIAGRRFSTISAIRKSCFSRCWKRRRTGF